MDYEYKGLELTGTVFKELLIKLYDGKQFKRETAIKEICKFHKENGGLLDKPSYINVFKKATQYLYECGIKNDGYGVWSLSYQEKEIIPLTNIDKNEFCYSVDKEIGCGEKEIYVYYYNRYREYAELKGFNKWECKIGRTDKDSISRIMSQSGTCFPELPHIALKIKCDDSNQLEKTIHNYLKSCNAWIENAPGKEWFITSPEIVESIYENIENNKL